jgi:oligopeptide transport system ATP-binding protein
MQSITGSEPDTILEIDDLRVSFGTYGGTVRAVRGISLSIRSGECLAVVGESGCGKSVTAQTVMRLIPAPPALVEGKITFLGEELLSLPERRMEAVRGSNISMVFQDPMTSLDPTMPIGKQIVESLRTHQRIGKREAEIRATDMLKLVGMPEPERQLKRYPHELSGGMRQRAMIAMAVVCRPRLLIADEPTTALDVTTQAQILDLIRNLKLEMGSAVMLITHDMGVVANIADRIAVFYAGQVVEEASVRDIFYLPAHPYTVALLHSRPRLDKGRGGELVSIAGAPPDLFAPPPGCGFAPRCGCALKVCSRIPPPSIDLGGGHRTLCWLHHEAARARYGEYDRTRLEKEVRIGS